MAEADNRKVMLPESLRARLKVIKVLGVGGMGAVLLAEDKRLGRPVAIKLLPMGAPERYGTRLAREAHALAQIRHPRVVQVYEFAETPQGPYLIMEYLEGVPLQEMGQDLDPVELMLDLADGLDAIHAAGLVHRDLKPQNILATKDRGAVMIDFGLALDLDRTRLTAVDSTVGTLGFIAPEVLSGGVATAASDWFAWGATLYYLLERDLPYDTAAIYSLIAGQPLAPRPMARVADPKLADLLASCLALDPTRRPTSASKARERLDAPVSPPPVSAVRASSQMLPRVAVSDSKSAQLPIPPGRIPRLAWVGMGLLAAVLGFGLLRSTAGPDRTLAAIDDHGGTSPDLLPEPRSKPRPGADGPFAPGFEDALAGELADLAELPLEERDPLLWGQRLADSPRLKATLDALASPATLSSLPAAVHGKLEAIDAECSRLRLPRVFHPYLYETPREQPIRLSAEVEDMAPPGLPPSFSRWFGRAAEHLESFLAKEEAWTKRLGKNPSGPYPGGIEDAGISAYFSLGAISLHRFLAGACVRPGNRIAARRDLRDMAEHAHAFAYCTARSLLEEPATALGAASILVDQTGAFRPLLYEAFAHAGPVRLLGVAPDRPELWLLYGELMRHRAHFDHEIGAKPDASYAEADRAYRLALAGGGETESARLARDLAATGLVRLHVTRGTWGAMQDEVARQLTRLPAYHPFAALRFVGEVGSRAAERDDGLGLSKANLRILADQLLAREQELDPKGDGTVAAWLAKLKLKIGP